jgi:predicted ATPase
MKIIRFEGAALHGYLNPRLKFFDDITFVTGINGSGKTTVINALIAVLSPSLSVLAGLEYESIRVDYENDGKRGSLAASKADGVIILSASGERENFSFAPYIPQDEISARVREREQEYYREVASANATNPVIRLINALPTPMFLDLQRRARYISEQAVYAPLISNRLYRGGRNVFSASLARSLEDAVSLAERSYRDAIVAVSRLGERLRRELVLQMLPLEPSVEFGQITVPTPSDHRDIKAMRQIADSLPQILNVPREEVRKRVVGFLDVLDKYARDVPAGKGVNDILSGGGGQKSTEVDALLKWSTNSPQLKKLRDITSRVEQYNSERSKITASTDRYRAVVNKFLGDSGKELIFDDRGDVVVKIAHLDEPRSVSSLSSGEAQIFVILTQLFFNPSAQQANVFIIDEPKLSLHVQWQELFVESVQEANPRVQHIMATHSPSIILDKVSHCRDLSPKQRRRRG